jgi:ATP-dependent helicase/nuclease subunit B
MSSSQDETKSDRLDPIGLFDGPTPRVFTIPPAASFLDSLAASLLRELDKPETPFALSDAIILLPTKRAARALGQAFLDARPGSATLLPRIRTIGDLDPDDAGLAELGDPIDATPIIDPLARQLTLARLIRARDAQADWADDPVAALSAAQALCDLLDSAAMTSQADKPFDWSALETLVADKDLAHHWEQSTTFLKIITQHWPDHLTAQGVVDPGVRQRRAIEGLIAAWQENPPKGAVILAGSTGSMPVTRALMTCVARLPKGAVVLPGLDLLMTQGPWADARTDDQHPQRAMAQAIEAIGIERHDVKMWPNSHESEALQQRRVVINEALTPQAATADWPSRIKAIGPDKIVLGLSGLSLIEAATEEEEANVIALELRETLQHDGQTAALVTPDATIARRVAAKLARWGVTIDVSAGRPLGETPVGTFMRLVALWAVDPADPVLLTSLLGHPLTCLGLDRSDVRQLAGDLEIGLLRGARKDKTLDNLLTRATHVAANSEHARVRLAASSARPLVEKLIDVQKLAVQGPAALDQAAQALAQLCEQIATTPNETVAEVLWRGEAGEAAAQFLSGLMEHGATFDALEPAQLARTLDSLMAGRVVRPRGTHPRLSILGPLEARLLRFDKIVLAGLDEGVWPKPPPPDPFLSRTMRASLGLPSPDTRIGLSAHDFAQLASAPRVIMTRANRRADAPAVPSRWLWRLKTLTRGSRSEGDQDGALAHPDLWLERLRASEPVRTFDTKRAIPAPRPPRHARPDSFFATQIETWIRDPYKLYIEKILRLRALDPLGGPPNVSERGTAVHAATEIVAHWYKHRPQNALADMRNAFRQELAAAGFEGFALETELIRFDPSIIWLAQTEMDRLNAGWVPSIEQKGKARIETGAGTLTLQAKADRIDQGPTGIEILDFKTGTPPSVKEVKAQFAAQLPVTALIVKLGGFEGVRGEVPSDLRHIRIGGSDFGDHIGVHKDTSVGQLIDEMHESLCKLHELYSDPNAPYLSKPRVQFIKKTSYEIMTDRVARRAEWANVDGEEA